MQQNTSVSASINPSAQNNGGAVLGNSSNINFAGFWKRVAITSIETTTIALLAIFVHPMAIWVVILANIALYFAKGMTIGDFVMQTKLVDAHTHEKPSTGQLIGRFFAKIISAIPLNLGFIWAGWANEKKAWHDSMSGIRYIETKTYNGGITWLVNILLSVVLPYFTMQPVISFMKDTVLPIGQGIFEGNPEKELEGINSFGDMLEKAARKQMEKKNENGELVREKTEEAEDQKPTSYKKPIPAPAIKKEIEDIAGNNIIKDLERVDTSEKIMVKNSEGNWSNYYTAGDKVYYGKRGVDNSVKYSLIEGADAETLEAIGNKNSLQGFWAKDKSNVYSEGGAIVRGADVNTIIVLNDIYAKDINSVFYASKKVEGADAETFEVVWGSEAKDKNNKYKYGKMISDE